MENITEPNASSSTSLLRTYCRFLRSPNLLLPPDSISAKQARSHTLRLYSIHLLLILLSLVAIQAFGLQEHNLSQGLFEQMPAWTLFLVAVVAAPVIEETIFRLPLRPFASSITLISSFILYAGLAVAQVAPGILLVALAMLVALNVYVWSQRSRVILFKKFYSQYPRLIFYFFTLLFGIVHIGNYTREVWMLLPLLVLPQTIIGLWLGFVRLRYGFGWSIFAHGFHNGCVLLPTLLFKVFGSDKFQAQAFDTGDIKALPATDNVLIGIVVLFVLGGLALCCKTAWTMIGEWSQSSSSL